MYEQGRYAESRAARAGGRRSIPWNDRANRPEGLALGGARGKGMLGWALYAQEKTGRVRSRRRGPLRAGRDRPTRISAQSASAASGHQLGATPAWLKKPGATEGAPRPHVRGQSTSARSSAPATGDSSTVVARGLDAVALEAKGDTAAALKELRRRCRADDRAAAGRTTGAGPPRAAAARAAPLAASSRAYIRACGRGEPPGGTPVPGNWNATAENPSARRRGARQQT